MHLLGNTGQGSGHMNDNGLVELAGGQSEATEAVVRSAFFASALGAEGVPEWRNGIQRG